MGPITASSNTHDNSRSALQHSISPAKPTLSCRQAAVLQCDRPTGLKFSGTGRLVAAGSTDGNICMWTQSHWQSSRNNGTHSSPGQSIGRSSATNDANLTPVRPTARRETAKPGVGRINSFGSAASPDRRLRGHILGVNDVAWTPEDRYLISASDDKMLRLWDVETGALLKNFKGHRQAVYCCTINPQGNIILSGSCDYSYRLWDLRTGNCFQHFEAHRDTVTSVDFTRVDGSCFMTASYDGACRIYDLLLGKCLRSVMHPFGEQNPPVGYARFSPNGRYLLASYLNSTIKVWDFTNLKATNVRTYTGHNNEKFSVPCAFVASRASAPPTAGKCLTPVSAHRRIARSSLSAAATDASGDFSPIMTSTQCCNQQRLTQWVVSGTENGEMVWWNVQSRAVVCRTPCYADDDYRDIVPVSTSGRTSSRQTLPKSNFHATMPGFRSLADIADTPSFNFNVYNSGMVEEFAQTHLVTNLRRKMTPMSTDAADAGSFTSTPNGHDSAGAFHSNSNAQPSASRVVIGLSAHPRASFVATSLRQNPYIRIWAIDSNLASSS